MLTIPDNCSFVEPTSVRPVSTLSSHHPSHWKTISEAAASEFLPNTTSDSKLLLILVCMLASSPFSLRLLFRGATPRKRWTEQGHIGESTCIGLAIELKGFLLSMSRLHRAVDELECALVVVKTDDDRYILDLATQARILNVMSPKLRQFWAEQALVITYRAIPWKYLESS